MLQSHIKRVLKRMLKSVGLYPFWPPTLKEESAFWQSILPEWEEILRHNPVLWQSTRAAVNGGPKILIATSVAGFGPTSLIDSLLAVALQLRGAQVHNLICDAALPACMMARVRYFGDTEKFVRKGPSKPVCATCAHSGEEMFRPLGLLTHRYSELISSQESQRARQLSSQLPADEIAQYQLDGVAVGEQAVAGALRFYMAGSLSDEPHGETLLRHYFHAALLTAYAMQRLFDTFPFDCVCFIHGIYVPHGVILEVARQRKVRIVSWSPTYRKQTFIFSHDDSYHRTLLSEPPAEWEDMPWTPKMEADIMDYLKSRWYGTHDWISYHKNPSEDVVATAEELGIDLSKPCIGLLTNVMGDGQLLYPSNAFPDMMEWVLQTIRYFADRPDLQLIIRVHPAEIRGTDLSRQPIIQEIKRAISVLPANIFIIPPEHPISTYALMMRCDTVIIYGTKAGVELASLGIPVIAAGEAWVRNKGVTFDVSSPSEYIRLLDRLPLKERLSEAATQRARKYAYHFFFRRMIPLPFLQPLHPAYKLVLSGLDELLPGRSIGLDVVCNGILKGDKFIYPAECVPETLSKQLPVAP